MNIKNLLIISLILIISFSNNAYALDNSWYSPSCVSPSYDTGYDLVWTSNNASSTGSIVFVSLNSVGAILAGNYRLANGTDILCGISSRTESIEGITRVIGTAEDGSVFYFDNNLVDYSLGFYSISPVTFTCAGAGGNCNPIYKIASLSSTTTNRRIVEDSIGNLYINDGLLIYKFLKETGYTQSIFFTLVADTDYTHDDGATHNNVYDLGIDSSDNIHVLIGTYNTGSINGGVTYHGYVSHTVITSSAVRLYTDLSMYSNSVFQGFAGFGAVSMLPDSINSTYNITLAVRTYTGSVTSVYHYAHTGGSTTIVSPVVGATNPYGMGYSGLLFHIPYLDSNIIRSYSTNYIGYVPSPEFVGITELTYTTKTISSTHPTYYNRSNVFIQYKISMDGLDNLLLDFDSYRWMVVLKDPNGVFKDVYQSSKCTSPFLSTICSVGETLEFAWYGTGWIEGTWTPYLYEINTVSGNRGLIASGTPYTILNTSLENQTTILPPTIPIESGTSPQALSLIDGIVALMGFGVNALSKFLFALIIVVVMVLAGFLMSNNNIMGGMIVGALPFCFFTFISYIPAWVIIVVMLIVALKVGWFR